MPYLASMSSVGGDYTGVIQLTVARSDMSVEQCSGTLLSDGLSILTSADCAQAANATVTFHLPTGSYAAKVAALHVNPLYNGSVQSPYDVAVLTLSAPAPLAAARYQLFEGDAVGDIVTLAGYGTGGTGATGCDALLYPPGTLRVGENEYDARPGGGDYLFDFDDGSAGRDALGDGTGLGVDEAMIAPDDSGGPSFVDGEIAGVHTLMVRALPGGASADTDGALNGSFGEYGGDARVSMNLAFIQSMMSPSPEPKTMFLVGVALVAISLMGRKRRDP
jgi:hypothetical protein